MITGNEPAMPTMIDGGETGMHTVRGLTIRAEIAARAMQGLLANPVYNNPDLKHKMVMVSDLAKCALSYTDALIAELNKPV